VASVNAGVIELTQTEAAPPPIAATTGSALIVSGVTAVLEHVPLLYVYTTVTVPAVKPVTIPPAVMLAVPVPGVIDHEPPAVASVNAGVVVFMHTEAVPPPIAATAGKVLTVRGAVDVFEQVPLVTVYTTVTVPDVRPVTTPPAVMLAVPVPGVIDHVPPAVASVKAGVVELAHTEAAPPAIAATDGVVFTVRVAAFDVALLAALQFVIELRYWYVPAAVIPATVSVAVFAFVYVAPAGVPFETDTHVTPLLYSH
jgi:hypothetical protein